MIWRRCHKKGVGDRGGIALMSALMLTVLLGVAAISVDIGMAYVQKRHLQAAADAAALAATYGVGDDQVISNAGVAQVAVESLVSNGYSAANLENYGVGVYCPDPNLAPAARYPVSNCANNSSIGSTVNADNVTLKITSPFYFGRVLGGSGGGIPVTVSATAAQIDEAGFYAGTGLASLNNGIVNSVLGSELGSNINLSAVDYNGLVQTNVTALSFFNALATELNVNSGTYGSLLNSSVTIGQILQAADTVLAAQGSNSTNSTNAEAGLASLEASVAGSPSVQLSKLFDLGIWQTTPLETSSDASALNAGINLYQLISFSSQIANGNNFITIPNSVLSIPGVATVTAASTVIEPPQSAPFGFGPVGISVHTSQVRLQLALKLTLIPTALSALGAASINVPIYVEVADGDAALTGISCGTSSATDAMATISASSGIARAFIGNVAQNVMTNFTNSVAAPTSTQIATVTLLGGLASVNVNAASEASLASGTPSTLTFNQTDVANKIAQTVSTTGASSNFLSTLQPTTLTASLNGVSLIPGITNSVTSGVTSALTPAFAGLDTLTDNILAAMGIKLGYMDVTVTGMRCGVPSLVQ